MGGNSRVVCQLFSKFCDCEMGAKNDFLQY